MRLSSTLDSLSPFTLYSSLIWASVILKTIIELHRWYFLNFTNTDSYFFERYIWEKNKRLSIIHAYWLFFRIALAGLLIVNEFVLPASVSLLLLFYIESKIYFKYHINYFIIIFLWFVLSHFRGREIGWSLIAIATAVMYWSWAYRKVQAGYLHNKNHMRDIFYFVITQSHNRKYADFYSSRLVAILLRFFDKIGWWKMNYLVITTQVLLPFLLLSPNNYLQLVWIFIWIFFHGLLTILYSQTLLHFSLITVSSYLLFYYLF